MNIDRQTGLLSGARFVNSPNQDDRHPGDEVNLLVIHNISLPPGQFAGGDIEAFFLNQLDSNKHPYYEKISQLKVSCHLLIRRAGEMIQFVPFHKRAWHAGESSFRGRTRCNDFSIGIELEGTDSESYTNIQYERLIECTQVIRESYPKISLDNIVGHCDISPNRKTDPGPSFDWAYYRKGLPS